jgi:hypothetical protein
MLDDNIIIVSKQHVLAELFGFGIFPSSGILQNTTFRKVDLFRLQVKVEEKTPTQLGPLERANLNHWATSDRFTQLFNHPGPS